MAIEATLPAHYYEDDYPSEDHLDIEREEEVVESAPAPAPEPEPARSAPPPSSSHGMDEVMQRIAKMEGGFQALTTLANRSGQPEHRDDQEPEITVDDVFVDFRLPERKPGEDDSEYNLRTFHHTILHGVKKAQSVERSRYDKKLQEVTQPFQRFVQEARTKESQATFNQILDGAVTGYDLEEQDVADLKEILATKGLIAFRANPNGDWSEEGWKKFFREHGDKAVKFAPRKEPATKPASEPKRRKASEAPAIGAARNAGGPPAPKKGGRRGVRSMEEYQKGIFNSLMRLMPED